MEEPLLEEKTELWLPDDRSVGFDERRERLLAEDGEEEEGAKTEEEAAVPVPTGKGRPAEYSDVEEAIEGEEEDERDGETACEEVVE